MKRLLASGALLALAGAIAPASAQETTPSGALGGVVRSTLGDRIPYALVALEPGYPWRFTDDSGSFRFLDLPPGTYHLRARQVGFKPLDTSVVVTGDGALVVAVALEHLVVELEAIRVVARSGATERCTEPGPPDPAVDPEFASVFDQLRLNAERYWLLADSYPAVFRVERRFGHPGRGDGRLAVERIDTVDLRTDARWHYAPGRVLSEVPGTGGAETQMNLPGLPDLADTAFLANHCFSFAGLEELDGRTYARLDFVAADAIGEPDASGSAYLDPATYLIRLTRVRLTRPVRASSDLQSLEVTEVFREVVPSLVLPDRISSVQTSRVLDAGAHIWWPRTVERVEEQRTVGFSFLRPLAAQRP